MKNVVAWTGLLLLAAVSALATVPAVAAPPSYWACEDGAWVAQGRPAYPQPLIGCGEDQGPVIRSEAECVRRGGRWGAAGIFPQKICILPTIDAARVCGDDNECQGSCLAELTEAQRVRVLAGRTIRTLGQCTPVTPLFGCQAVVHKGLVAGILCLD